MVRLTDKRKRSLFMPPKNKEIAEAISITSPKAFKQSIFALKQGGLTTEEWRSLNLARVRAKLQLKRNNLSSKERRQFTKIARTPLPKITKK